MAGAKVTVEVEGGPLVLETLGRLRDVGARLRPAFAAIGEALLLSHEERWDRQVDPDGQPWQPLSERYRERKRKKGKPDKILVLDQHLKNLAYDATDEGLLFGTPWPYGATHQFGAPERGIPARPFLGLDEDDRAMVLDVLQAALEDAIAGTGHS